MSTRKDRRVKRTIFQILCFGCMFAFRERRSPRAEFEPDAPARTIPRCRVGPPPRSDDRPVLPVFGPDAPARTTTRWRVGLTPMLDDRPVLPVFEPDAPARTIPRWRVGLTPMLASRPCKKKASELRSRFLP